MKYYRWQFVKAAQIRNHLRKLKHIRYQRVIALRVKRKLRIEVL